MCHQECLNYSTELLEQAETSPFMVLVGSDSGYFLTTRWGKFCRRAEDIKQKTLGVRWAQVAREGSS